MPSELGESIEKLRYYTNRLRAQRLRLPLPGSLLTPTITCAWRLSLEENDVLVVVGLEFAENKHRLILYSTLDQRLIVGPTWTEDEDDVSVHFKKIQ